jgi:riboflavin kinase/FMN adenylyltransferase
MPAIAIGKFDALHLGHRALLEQAAGCGEPVLMTFTGMAETLGWTARLPLVAPADRNEVLAAWSRELGRDITHLELPFAAIREMSPRDFVTNLRDRHQARAVIVGEDFRFGRDRCGGTGELIQLGRELGIGIRVVDHLSYRDAPISSSRIRTDLATGDLASVAACLGRPYRFIGTVARGDGRGRSLGFPTANCGSPETQEPATGVYAAWARFADDANRRFPAAVNIGHLPTVGGNRPLSVEAHLLGFAGDGYGRRLALDFTTRLRAELRLPDLDALRRQLAQDIAQVRELLTKN